MMTFKCINGLAPDYLACNLLKRSDIHTRNTRSCNNLNIPKYTTTSGQRPFTYRADKIWNSLDTDLKGEGNLSKIQERRQTSLPSGLRHIALATLSLSCFHCHIYHLVSQSHHSSSVLALIFHPIIFLISKIQLVVYYQWCVLIGWASTRLYVIAH